MYTVRPFLWHIHISKKLSRMVGIDISNFWQNLGQNFGTSGSVVRYESMFDFDLYVFEILIFTVFAVN